MMLDDLYAEIDKDLDAAISKIAAYAKQVAESEKSASHLGERLNGELPPRFADLERSFVANLESKLGDVGEAFVQNLDVAIRIRYYEAEIERTSTKDISCSSWTRWHPELTPKVQTAAAGCAVLAGAGTGLSLAKALGVLPIKLPLFLGSPVATVLLFLALTCAASAIAMRPDGLQIILDHERRQAQNHLDAFLATIRQELAQAARRAASSALTELEKLKISPTETSQ